MCLGPVRMHRIPFALPTIEIVYDKPSRLLWKAVKHLYVSIKYNLLIITCSVCSCQYVCHLVFEIVYLMPVEIVAPLL